MNVSHLIAAGAALLTFTSALAQDVPIIQPGAPGADDRELSAKEAIDIAVSGFSPDDVRFMTDMIPHHNQAVQMAALVADRTNRKELVDVAGRIDASQDDEIEFMKDWLRARGQEVPDPAAHSAMHTTHEMAGMASPEQMAALAKVRHDQQGQPTNEHKSTTAAVCPIARRAVLPRHGPQPIQHRGSPRPHSYPDRSTRHRLRPA